MTKVIYEGPFDKINVAPFGEHQKGREKEYPDDFAKELIETSKRNKFSISQKQSPPQKQSPEPPVENTKEEKQISENQIPAPPVEKPKAKKQARSRSRRNK